ncbi:toxin-antitoxin system protein [uncultured Duncaniella sp.]|uniref:toxin-antitoxin system protein n=1 Tax=uncultured Duncaniella sp. TaxID=2768039 RepID=UPI00344A95D9
MNTELVDKLRVEARRHNRSLNNYVESILMAFVSEQPNNLTLAAMEEAESGRELEALDMRNFRKFVDSL